MASPAALLTLVRKRPASTGTLAGGGGVAGGGKRGPQSAQSMPSWQKENSAPSPPSSQLPSKA